MKHLRHTLRLLIGLLVVLVAAGAVPALACTTMTDCPMAAPARGCHESPHGNACSPLRVAGAENHCGALTAPSPVLVGTSEKQVVTAAADLPESWSRTPGTPAHPDRGPEPAPPPPRRATGRALLSLHQIFLI